MKYYERLRQAREDADLTQAQAAEIIQTTQSYFSRQELGKKPFRVEQVAKLCEYYHVSSDYSVGLSRDLKWPRDH